MKFVPRCLSDLFKSSPKKTIRSEAARPVRFLLAGHDLKFTGPFHDYFSNNPRYEFRIDEHPGHEIASEKQSRESLEWADVIFCEWALGNLVWYSKHKKPGQMLLARLHSQEWNYRDRLDYIYKTDWNRVDKLLLVTPVIYDHIIQEFPQLGRGKAQVLNCPIDTDAYVKAGQSARKKYALGFVGMVPAMKRLDLALEMLEILQREVPEFSLHIKGKRPEEYPWMLQREEEMRWYEGLYSKIKELKNPDSVIFYEHGSDMPEWYASVSFLLSTSDHEGCHLSVAESMLAGCVPSIRSWDGANRIYPPRFVWSTPEEGAQKILALFEENAREEASAFSRTYAEERFSQGHLCEQVDSMIMRHFETVWPAVVSGKCREISSRLLPNILFVGYLASSSQSGYRIRIEQEIRALARAGARIHFACCHPEMNSAVLNALKVELDALPCPVSFHRAPSFFDMKLTAAEVKALLDSLEEVLQKKRIDILHCEALYCARIGTMLKERKPELKLFFDCHGISPEEEAMGGAAKTRVEKVNQLEMEVLFRTDLNIFVSEAMQQHFRNKHAYVGENYWILPCCVAESQFASDREETEQRLSLPQNALILSYAGTLAAWQCGEEMLRLFSLLHQKESRLHFLLLLPEKEQEKAREWLHDYGVSDESVTMLEARHDEVPLYLQEAHAGLLLRKEDPVNQVASPTKFGEYLAAGLPVLLTEGIGDFSALVEKEGLGMIVPSSLLDTTEANDEELEQILQFLKQTVSGRDQMRRRCVHYARTELHWERHAHDFLKAITR
ncbi:MAG TPA: glycosyltransferase [Candidatus Hydrogenedentes bacterium]|jgi:glycosyltransferase involved in cell wall biosynthesis|nr:MAG: putative glycosyl transferase [Candidatus Hydrogenedentes bacterium ADurb.Bin170]HOM47298.1 glycosyltransferase [Candidatus Hydrogenedentota bacterium]HPX85201.1 glycosyltransferase [Candidatus Hydrogenedentota bacterium]